jgi:DMSO/TMAO reductase YedYZ heme-binding membrane subunit
VNSIGALALYALVLVVVTSYARHRLTRRAWKRLHYVAYGVAGTFLVHGLLADPTLRHHPVDWLDGEKVAIEICSALIAAFGVLRLRGALRRAVERQHHGHLQPRRSACGDTRGQARSTAVASASNEPSGQARWRRQASLPPDL